MEEPSDRSPRLKCATCDGEVAKSDFLPGNPWVHTDDETIISKGLQGTVQISKYDHPAVPAFIEARLVGETQPEQPKIEAPVRPASPFAPLKLNRP